MNCEQCAVYGFCEMIVCEFKMRKSLTNSTCEEQKENTEKEDTL